VKKVVRSKTKLAETRVSSMDTALQKRLFSSLDVNGDGGISLAELQLALKTNQEFAALAASRQPGVSGPLSPIEVALISRKLEKFMDADGDGEISFEEFKEFCAQAALASGEQDAKATGKSSRATSAKPPVERNPSGGRLSKFLPGGRKSSAVASPSTGADRSMPTPRRLLGGDGKQRAEARMAALLQALRTEVIGGAESKIEHVDQLKLAPSDQGALYRTHILLMLDQLRRLCGSCEGRGGESGGGGGGGGCSSGGGAESCEAEVLTLRRDLALVKLELAEVSAECEELEHETRQLRATLKQGSRSTLFT